MKDRKGFIGVVILVVIAIALLGGGGYYFYKKSTPSQTTTEKVNITQTGNAGGLEVKTNINTIVTKTVDCGDKICFNKKFSTCESATIQSDTQGLGAVSYKILGPAPGGCSITMKYTKNPNPDWVNKEMTCTFDNKVDFETSVQKTFNGVIHGTVTCQGPLYTLLRSL